MANQDLEETPTTESPPATPDTAGQGGLPAAPDETAAGSLDLVMDVPVRVTVEIGSARALVRDVLRYDKGSVIELDRMSGEPADILVNGRILARGEVTVVDERLAVRVVEVVGGVGGARAG